MKRNVTQVLFWRVALGFIAAVYTQVASANNELINPFASIGDIVRVSVIPHWHSQNPTEAFEYNTALDKFSSDRANVYYSANSIGIKELQKEIRNLDVSANEMLTQLMYVNTLVVFQLENKGKAYLLIGKYYQADDFVNAELHLPNNHIKSFVMNKTIHKSIRHWVQTYADLDIKLISKKVTKICERRYENDVKANEGLLFLLKSSPRKASLRKIIGSTKSKINLANEALLNCDSPESLELASRINKAYALMRINYLKRNPKQICKMSKFHLVDAQFCELGWTPSSRRSRGRPT